MRRFRFHRQMLLLASLAMLLVVVAPVISRWLAAPHDAGSPALAATAAAGAQMQGHHQQAHAVAAPGGQMQHHAMRDAGHVAAGAGEPMPASAQHPSMNHHLGHPARVDEPAGGAIVTAASASAASHASEPAPALTPASRPSPHAAHDMGVECDYCLIAARLIVLLVAACLLLLPLAPVCRARMGTVRVLPSRLTGTLGARGPPSFAC